jgi:hypothetical protein
MASNRVIKFNVPNLPGLFQTVYAFDEQAYESTSIFEADRLFHVDGLGEFPIQIRSFDIQLPYS